MEMSKALIVEQFHSIDALKIGNFRLVDMEEDMIEVKVHYCGVNFADIYTIHQFTTAQVPFVIGIECSGVVTNIGNATNGIINIGDKVICYDYNGGMHREIIRLHYNKCYKIPDFIDLETAAAIFVNYLTAWFSLFSIGHLTCRQNLFISSCAGGVGLATIKIAKHALDNVHIYGTASASKQNFVEDLGVTFISYDELEELDEEFDLVIESQSTETRNILMQKLKPFGKLVIIGAKDLINSERRATDPNINAMDLIFGNSVMAGLHIGILADEYPDIVRDALDSIFDLMKSCESVKPLLKVFNFNRTRDALRELSDRRNIGKILLKL